MAHTLYCRSHGKLDVASKHTTAGGLRLGTWSDTICGAHMIRDERNAHLRKREYIGAAAVLALACGYGESKVEKVKLKIDGENGNQAERLESIGIQWMSRPNSAENADKNE